MGTPAPAPVDELREVLEAQAAEWAAQRRHDTDLSTMLFCLRALEADLSAGRSSAAAERRFRTAVVDAAHNPALAATLVGIGDQHRETGEAMDGRVARGRGAALRRIFDAIVAREPAPARALMLDYHQAGTGARRDAATVRRTARAC